MSDHSHLDHSLAADGGDERPDGADELPERFADAEVIGRGGAGVVFRAFDRRTERTVAVKRLRASRAESRSAIERFRREAKIVAALYDRNIVQVEEVIDDDEGLLIVMEHVDGPDLERFCRQADGPLPPLQAFSIARQIAGALMYAHDKGIVHRDIKPANVVMAPDGTPKIVDFGLARIPEGGSKVGSLDTITGEGAALGTPDYMAPEQARDPRAADARADVYSLGAVLYRMLTGQSPRTIREARLPEATRYLVMRALEDDPARRFASMTELGLAIHAAISFFEGPQPHDPDRSSHRSARRPANDEPLRSATSRASALLEQWGELIGDPRLLELLEQNFAAAEGGRREPRPDPDVLELERALLRRGLPPAQVDMLIKIERALISSAPPRPRTAEDIMREVRRLRQRGNAERDVAETAGRRIAQLRELLHDASAEERARLEKQIQAIEDAFARELRRNRRRSTPREPGVPSDGAVREVFNLLGIEHPLDADEAAAAALTGMMLESDLGEVGPGEREQPGGDVERAADALRAKGAGALPPWTPDEDLLAPPDLALPGMFGLGMLGDPFGPGPGGGVAVAELEPEKPAPKRRAPRRQPAPPPPAPAHDLLADAIGLGREGVLLARRRVRLAAAAIFVAVCLHALSVGVLSPGMRELFEASLLTTAIFGLLAVPTLLSRSSLFERSAVTFGLAFFYASFVGLLAVMIDRTPAPSEITPLATALTTAFVVGAGATAWLAARGEWIRLDERLGRLEDGVEDRGLLAA